MGDLMQLAVYNPAILKDEDFLKGFVARLDLLEVLVARLRDLKPRSLAKHRLILGQRGMGKSTLLRRLALAVRDDAALAEVLLPLTFREEQYNVHNLHTFWCNCLDALADHFERTGQTEKAAEVDRQVANLNRDRKVPAREDEGEEALACLKAWGKREGRRFLLLLDNVDLILGGLAKQDWAFRRVLQEPGGLVLVGAATAYLEATTQPEGAFYDFFQVSVLERLNQEELIQCLRRLAENRAEAGRNVLRVLATDPGRVRALHDLTGGNLRTLVLLYLLLERGADDGVMGDLERLLDEVTPLYKARVEDLAPQARVILDAVALHWDPLTAAKVAEITGMETTLVSAQLDRLLRNGVVEKAVLSHTGRAAFQVGERFFNIWYLMRHGPRRQRARLRWLTAFLRGFYTPGELTEKARMLLRGRKAQGHYALALGEAVEDEGLRHCLGQDARRALEALAAQEGKRLEDLMDPSELPAPKSAMEWFHMGWWLDEDLQRPDDAEAAYRRAIELDPNFAWPWNNLGNLLKNHLGRYEEAEAAYRRAIELDPNFAWPWNNLGILLQDHLGRYEEAEAAYRRAMELDPKNAVPWNSLGNLLQDHLGRSDDAIDAYTRSLELNSGTALAHTNLAYLHLNRGDWEAVQPHFQAGVAALSRHGASLLRAYAALCRDNFGEATEALREALDSGHSELQIEHFDDLLRLLQRAAAQGYGERLLAWFESSGFGDRYWPIQVAFEAYLYGEARLGDVNPEVGQAARRIYRWLQGPAPTPVPASASKPRRKKG